MNQYVVIKYLGRGACGRVFLCMDMTDNRLYAVKVCAQAACPACVPCHLGHCHVHEGPEVPEHTYQLVFLC